MKEFLQTITWFNPKIIESVVQGVSVFMTKKTVAKMLDLPKIGINKLPTKPTKEKEREKEVAIYQPGRQSWEGRLFGKGLCK